mmetsp:Transcript_15280/g.39388  ORF Transcript_15280/g.39388 Transcript_15280/m.39388 type:complete len:501 (+) Transcript_15280:536-2038(+)
MRILLGGGLRRKGVRKGSAEGNERHGGDGVGDLHDAAEHRRQVPDEGRDDSDCKQGGAEAQPAAAVVGGRDAGEEHLPENRGDMHDPIQDARLLVIITFLVASIDHERVAELVPPVGMADLRLVPVTLDDLHDPINTALCLLIRLNHDGEDVLLRAAIAIRLQLRAAARLREDQPKLLFGLVPPSGLDGEVNGRGHLAIPELEVALYVGVVQILRGRRLLRDVVHGDAAGAACFALNRDGHVLVLHTLLDLEDVLVVVGVEGEGAWFVVIHDHHLGSGEVLAQHSQPRHVIATWVGEVHEELLVVFVGRVIDDLDADSLRRDARRERQGPPDWHIVRVRDRRAVAGLVVHIGSRVSAALPVHVDRQGADALEYGVLRRREMHRYDFPRVLALAAASAAPAVARRGHHRRQRMPALLFVTSDPLAARHAPDCSHPVLRATLGQALVFHLDEFRQLLVGDILPVLLDDGHLDVRQLLVRHRGDAHRLLILVLDGALLGHLEA